MENQDDEESVLSQTRWRLSPPPDAGAVQAFVRDLEILPLTASILIQRGWRELTSARRYLATRGIRLADFRELPGASAAGEVLARAVQNRTRIAVVGDYDVDGITAAAILAEFVRERGGDCRVYLPDRVVDGYGLSSRLIRRARVDGASLLLTVDCGVTAAEEVSEARAAGLTVVVTDHHEPGRRVPEAAAVVNPKLQGPADLRNLAGVGVALLTVRAAAAALGESDPQSLYKFLDLAALGTIADVVPLVGDNRTLARLGLDSINRGERPGIAALVRVAGLQPGTLNSMDVAFKLAPRLNAAGRLGDAHRSLDLLLTRNHAEAERLAEELDRENKRRRQIEQQILEQAEEQLAAPAGLPRVLLVKGTGWPLGLLGLVASKLSERYHRPCFACSEEGNWIRGSGRSISSFPLPKALALLDHLLCKWGGHDLAAGITLEARQWESFSKALRARAETELNDAALVPELRIDAAAGLEDLTPRLVRELRRMEPHGFGNERAVLALHGLNLAAAPRVVGERHLKLRVASGRGRSLDVIGFGLAGRAGELELKTPIAIAGHLGENVWNGSANLQLEMKDFKVGETAEGEN